MPLLDLEPRGRPTLHGTLARAGLQALAAVPLAILTIAWYVVVHIVFRRMPWAAVPQMLPHWLLRTLLFDAPLLFCLALQASLQRQGRQALAPLAALVSVGAAVAVSMWLQAVAGAGFATLVGNLSPPWALYTLRLIAGFYLLGVALSGPYSIRCKAVFCVGQQVICSYFGMISELSLLISLSGVFILLALSAGERLERRLCGPAPGPLPTRQPWPRESSAFRVLGVCLLIYLLLCLLEIDQGEIPLQLATFVTAVAVYAFQYRRAKGLDEAHVSE